MEDFVDASDSRLARTAGISGGLRVPEIDCGTRNLTILVKRLNPASQVVGIDPNPAALARARRKVERRGVTIQFDEALPRNCHIPTHRSTGFSLQFMSTMLFRLAMCRQCTT